MASSTILRLDDKEVKREQVCSAASALRLICILLLLVVVVATTVSTRHDDKQQQQHPRCKEKNHELGKRKDHGKGITRP
jgi:hypothetical protein